MKCCVAVVISVTVTLTSLLAAENRGIAVRSAQDAGVVGYDPGRMYAIVIGINSYHHWPKLRGAVTDAKDVATTLCRYYGFPTNQVKLLLDEEATRRNVLAVFDAACDLSEEDNLVIFYAGHGWMDSVKNGFWIPVEAQEDSKVDYISNNQIVGDCFKKYQVKHLLVVADSCFSGAMLRGSAVERQSDWKLPTGFQKPSRLVLTSGDLQPVSDGVDGHSPFTERFLQFLKYGDSKTFGVQDMYVFVRKNLGTQSVCAPLDTPKHMPGGELALCRLDSPLGPVEVVSLVRRKDAVKFSSPGADRTPEPEAFQVIRKHDIRQLSSMLDANGTAVIGTRGDGGATLLHLAAAQDDTEVIQLLVARGAVVDAPADNKATPLHWTANCNAASAVRMLLDNGANINARTGRDFVPLHWAALGNATNVIAILLERGAKRSLRNDEGKVPLDLAVEKKADQAAAILRSAK